MIDFFLQYHVVFPEIIDSILTFDFYMSYFIIVASSFPLLSKNSPMTIHGALSLINRLKRCNLVGRVERECILFDKRSSVNLYPHTPQKSVTFHSCSTAFLTRAIRFICIKSQIIIIVEN